MPGSSPLVELRGWEEGKSKVGGGIEEAGLEKGGQDWVQWTW